MQTKTNDRVYAGFFVRLAAYLIDWLIVGAALLIVRLPLWIASWSTPNNILTRDFIFQYSVTDIVIYVLTVGYFILLTYFTGATLGKRLLHLRVVSTEEREASFFEIAYRETVGKFLSGVCICIGYLMIGLDRKGRGLHDILADTCVIYCHEKKRYVAPPVVYRDRNVAGTAQNAQDGRPYMSVPGQQPVPEEQFVMGGQAVPEEQPVPEEKFVPEQQSVPEGQTMPAQPSIEHPQKSEFVENPFSDNLE